VLQRSNDIKTNKMETLKYDKRTQVKFETAKDFLTANKRLVLSTLKSQFLFDVIDSKTLAVDYFNYIQVSQYKDSFTLPILKKQIHIALNYSVKNFKAQYKTLREDSLAVNDFNEERRMAGFASKSF
jgi:hypothetical protein